MKEESFHHLHHRVIVEVPHKFAKKGQTPVVDVAHEVEAFPLEEDKDDFFEVPGETVVEVGVRVEEGEDFINHRAVLHRHKGVQNVVDLAAEDFTGHVGVLVQAFVVGGRGRDGDEEGDHFFEG